jgi:RNA polymerase sigma-70 factor (ECF subfamily)
MGPVYRYGIGFCRDPDDASDVSQDVMLALVRNLRRFRGDASLLTWAYVVARRACTRHRKRRHGEPAARAALTAPSGDDADRSLEIPSPEPQPDEDLERRELRGAIEDAIAALPRPQREVILLRDVEGLSTREVARALRLGEHAVKSRLHRARAALRWRLADRPEPADAARGCPDTARLLSLHLEGDLSASICARLSKHVAACPKCAATCASLRDTLRECRQYGRARLPEHARTAVRNAIRSAVEALTE